MDASFTPVACVLGFALILILFAALKSAVHGYHVRPNPNEFVQLTWSERENLERSRINGGFWRFVAKLEFFLLICAGLYILILLNFR